MCQLSDVPGIKKWFQQIWSASYLMEKQYVY